mgnify:CR=1 FL=1
MQTEVFRDILDTVPYNGMEGRKLLQISIKK